MFIFFLLRAKYVFILRLTRALEKFGLYLDFCILVSVHASTCLPKIPAKVKIFISIGSLRRTTHDSCLYCSVVWKMSSQILTGIEKVDNVG